MSILDNAKKAWTPINADDYGPRNIPWSRWGTDALTCLMLDRQCVACPLNNVFGFGWGYEGIKACYIPIAVQSLLNRNIDLNKIFLKASPGAILEEVFS
jgi:hypothetical protein